MKNKLLSITAGLLLSAALAGCTPAVHSSTQASYVDMETAKSVALSAAQVNGADAAFTSVELEQNNGAAYYQVRFTAGGQDYNYAIDAMTGTVIEFTGSAAQQGAQGTVDTQVQDGTTTAPEPSSSTTAAAQQGQGSVSTTGQIGEDEAKRIALQNAGVQESDTAYLSVRLDRDDGRMVYDVEFYVAATNTEYDYEINATDGTIRSMDYDAENYAPVQSGTASSGTTKTEAEARSIALAKVPGATQNDIRLYLDNDDGRLQYEGTIIYQNMKYEFEIDAYSGAIREWDAESVFD
nr:PepSY domain-containing protein [uncultured Agathobaculum sp.]